MTKRLGLSVIGCGRVAGDHFQALQTLTEVELIAVADSDEAKAATAAREYKAKRWHTDYHRILEDAETEAVIIAAPTQLHYQITMEALAAGKHVLVEKPMSETAEQAVEMVDAASRRGLRLMVGQVMRFLPIFSEAKRLIAEGRLGRPIHALERRLCYCTEAFLWWRETRGFLIAHHGSHTIDLFIWLFDSRPVRVYADASSTVPSYPGEDDFGLQMVLSNGALVSLHHSFLSHFPAHDIVIIGSEGTISVECFSKLSFNGEVVIHRNQQEILGAGFRHQIKEFVDSISQGREPASSGADVKTTMRAIDAARRSAEQHVVVEI